MIYSIEQLRTFAVAAGFLSEDQVATIAAIAMAESGGDDMAFNAADPHGGSFGVLQINGIHTAARDCLGNAALSFNMAYGISGKGTDFKPWSTFTSGRYKKFMPEIHTIAASPIMNVTELQSPALPHLITKGTTMNSAHITATGGLAAALTGVIFWHGNGAPSLEVSADLAAIILGALAWLGGRFPNLTTKGK